jgi:hypothetical protein
LTSACPASGKSIPTTLHLLKTDFDIELGRAEMANLSWGRSFPAKRYDNDNSGKREHSAQ